MAKKLKPEREKRHVPVLRGRAEEGGKDNGKPGPRPDYGSDYYTAYLFDPEGNNVEAVTYGR
jgi:hypothetical protein